ncbi:MAG: hypothetical protein ACXVUL_18890 [Solirubrobacteraceae bacterium]
MPIVAVMAAGYQPRLARAMVDVLQHVSERWQPPAASQPWVARPRAA